MKFEIVHKFISKKVPLTISRETITGQNNIFLKIHHEGYIGIGETVFDLDIEKSIRKVSQFLESYDDYSPVKAWEDAFEFGLNSCEVALIDTALWDLLAKKSNMPLHQLLGLEYSSPKTSITVSIGEPSWVYERTVTILKDYNPSILKIKLGTKDGIEKDKASIISIKKAISDYGKQDLELFVDANGGWSLEDAKEMISWLADQGIIFVEQPLAPEDNCLLKELCVDRKIPIYVDESCCFASDLQHLHEAVDGVNIKLLKCGGITEALRIIHAARAFDLDVMMGCFGETAGSLTAATSLSSLLDYVDLDSFINLEMETFASYKANLSYSEGRLHYKGDKGIGVGYE